MPEMQAESLTDALVALGELLGHRQQEVELVVIGGGALLLDGVISRPTKDLDAVARVESGTLTSSEPLPGFLEEAVADIARAYNLDPEWLNGRPTSLLDLGLPEGLLERTRVLTFGPLTLRTVHRIDQIHFKLYATIDWGGPESKHYQDLIALNPTREELETAFAWCRTHDISEAFATSGEKAIAAVLEATGV